MSLRALTLSLLLISASCSDAGPSDRVQIAVIPKGTTHEFWKSVHAGAETAAQELGVEIIWKGPLVESDRNAQIQVVEDFVTRGVDGIVLMPLDRVALVPPEASTSPVAPRPTPASATSMRSISSPASPACAARRSALRSPKGVISTVTPHIARSATRGQAVMSAAQTAQSRAAASAPVSLYVTNDLDGRAVLETAAGTLRYSVFLREKPADTVRIFALGASSVHGSNYLGGEAWPALLGHRLGILKQGFSIHDRESVTIKTGRRRVH